MIDILMGTYNGEKFIAQQIDSIIAQTCTEWRLFVRDDGSTDSTLEIVRKYAAQHSKRIRVVDGEGGNLGVSGNFSRLLEMSEADYIMFADQDDVWVTEKIEKTLNKMKIMESLHGEHTPLLVHSDLVVVDKGLNKISDSFWRYQSLDPKIKDLNRYLIQNQATGCTMMMNRPLKKLALPIPECVMMHDWWIVLVAVAFGRIDYVDEATIYYRQHGDNAEGAKEWNLSRLFKSIYFEPRAIGNRIRTGKAQLLKTQKQAGLFLDRYKALLDSDVKKMLEIYANLDRMSFVSKRFYFLKFRLFQKGFLRNVFLFFWI